ncbi:unnamed protein product [Spirodela intermedia]|uniref:WW domain-containing protein n=1 Tax=Spirodela intermedia TaxID=51605 RepID=A0A7I8JRP3_SPIIN|nr:unnamed protein product [Spirodela intermedia]CAA6672425.1 unnamed protein product [Spirodela intermedia]
MGKRKERRLAAKSAAGRRVKLDLFAEPTEEMVSKPSNEEVTGDPDQDHHAGVPSSPSTSGQKQENPLLLLGQYSDDEANDDVTTEPKIEVEENLDADSIQENGHGNDNGNAECSTDRGMDPGDIEKVADEVDNDIHPPDALNADSTADACGSTVSEIQSTGDSIDGWKVVVDEQTNRYYYWNILTGETSWEVPDVLSHKAATIEGNGIGVNTTHDASQSAEDYNSAGIVGVSYPDALMLHSFASLSQTSALSDQLTDSTSNLQFVASNESMDKHHLEVSYNSEAEEVHPAHLVKHGEILLERLKTLEWSDENHERHSWRFKCISEVETRLSDCKALSSFGSALLPFWWHTKTQLNRIEYAIDQEESLVHKNSGFSKEEFLKPEGSVDSGKECELVTKESMVSSNGSGPQSDICVSNGPSKETTGSPKTEDAGGMVAKGLEETMASAAFVPHPSVDDSGQAKAGEEDAVNPVATLHPPAGDLDDVQSTDNPSRPLDAPLMESYAEDVDMDIEMEVDEEEQTVSEQQAGTQCVALSQHMPYFSHEVSVPSPPEDWIPPPPPEDDAPPPSSYSETYPSFPYPDQYTMQYPVSAFEYYAPSVSGAPGMAYYVPADAAHVAEPQPAIYYDVPAAVMPPAPIISCSEASGFYVQSDVARYGSLSSSELSSSAAAAASSSSASHKAEEPRCLDEGADPGPLTSVGSQSTGSTPSDAAASAANVKAQPKANSGGGTTLRSNKKVSSLVDKWKAAKEELHGDEEDEPENAYEILEKKRQKEIEQWKTRQIVSGEAQENANFLPLGGDWYVSTFISMS